MESSILIYLVLAISAISLALLVYVTLKMKTVVYLLEQPVVKKMSPQLKLKPVKMDEVMTDRNRNNAQPQNRDARPHQHGSFQGNNPRQGGRPEGDRREGNRGDRPQGERRDGDRNRGGNDRFRDRNNNRGDRPQGQGGRPERAEGERRNDGDRRPPREFNENREQTRDQNAPVPQSAQNVIRNESPSQQDAPLSPRRPLPATVESHDHSNAATTNSFDGGSEAFVGTDGDMQHGRRIQIKKKPRFEMDEAEVKVEG